MATFDRVFRLSPLSGCCDLLSHVVEPGRISRELNVGAGGWE